MPQACSFDELRLGCRPFGTTMGSHVAQRSLLFFLRSALSRNREGTSCSCHKAKNVACKKPLLDFSEKIPDRVSLPRPSQRGCATRLSSLSCVFSLEHLDYAPKKGPIFGALSTECSISNPRMSETHASYSHYGLFTFPLLIFS